MTLGPLTIKHLGEKNLVGHLYFADFHAVFDDFVIVKGKINGVKDAGFLRRPGENRQYETKTIISKLIVTAKTTETLILK